MMPTVARIIVLLVGVTMIAASIVVLLWIAGD